MIWRMKGIIVGIVLVIATIGITMAFYSNKDAALENIMITRNSSVYLQELFDPTDDWLPGEIKQKKVNFGNKGEKDQVIRFRIEVEWLDEDGGLWLPTTDNPAEIQWAPTLPEEWITFSNDDKWYYYKKVLSAGEETAEVMEGVLFSTKASNDIQVEDFTNTTYRIVIYMEGLDVNPTITQKEWKKTFHEDNGLVWARSNN